MVWSVEWLRQHNCGQQMPVDVTWYTGRWRGEWEMSRGTGWDWRVQVAPPVSEEYSASPLLTITRCKCRQGQDPGRRCLCSSVALRDPEQYQHLQQVIGEFSVREGFSTIQYIYQLFVLSRSWWTTLRDLNITICQQAKEPFTDQTPV